MVMRASGFERKIEKATAIGRKVGINEYFPPETRCRQVPAAAPPARGYRKPEARNY